jgi:hypothetical protein
MLLVILFAFGDLISSLTYRGRPPLAQVRNFFGTLTVSENLSANPRDNVRTLVHGTIRHGLQFIEADRRRLPVSYFGPKSGIGRTIEFYLLSQYKRDSLRIGVVGLGIGTLATYAPPGGSIRFYELNPLVADIAKSDRWFTYLSDCKARYDIQLGDARLTLERELSAGRPQHFHVLALDAFSSDAIPIHLLTVEAFKVYVEHLATRAMDGEDGAIAVHITNRYVDLDPVIRGGAQRLGLSAVHVLSQAEPARGVDRANWIVVTRNERLVELLAPFSQVPIDIHRRNVVWTDSYSNLFDVLK